MSSDEKIINEEPPLCKPFRICELIVVTICFTLLFFLRQFDAKDEIICSPDVLIYFFTTLGSTLVVTAIEVFCQLAKIPVPNFPIILIVLMASLLTLSSGTAALFVYSQYENYNSLRNLHTICLLAAGCFLACLIYILDLLVIIRFSCN